jgi:hypothetical protein
VNTADLRTILADHARLSEIVEAVRRFEIALQQHRAVSEGSPMEQSRAFTQATALTCSPLEPG